MSSLKLKKPTRPKWYWTVISEGKVVTRRSNLREATKIARSAARRTGEGSHVALLSWSCDVFGVVGYDEGVLKCSTHDRLVVVCEKETREAAGYKWCQGEFGGEWVMPK